MAWTGHVVGARAYRHALPEGSVESADRFPGWGYAGKDPITDKQLYVRGETRRDRRDAEAVIAPPLAARQHV
jgi:hypothetical protein